MTFENWTRSCTRHCDQGDQKAKYNLLMSVRSSVRLVGVAGNATLPRKSSSRSRTGLMYCIDWFIKSGVNLTMLDGQNRHVQREMKWNNSTETQNAAKYAVYNCACVCVRERSRNRKWMCMLLLPTPTRRCSKTSLRTSVLATSWILFQQNTI